MNSATVQNGSGTQADVSKRSQASTVRSNARTASKLQHLESEPHTFREPFLQRTEMLRSAWTPQEPRKKTLNEQLYLERRALIHHWFDMWTAEQRMRFLKQFMTKCMKIELQFVEAWFIDTVPLARVDMTRVLPRHLSLKILGYLDPRSLCRAAQVSWYWRFLAEQDMLWRPKCERNGWYIPYTPADNEIAAYKRYYVACWFSLDNTMLERDRGASAIGEQMHSTAEVYGAVGGGETTLEKSERHLMEQLIAEEVLENEPMAAIQERISKRALQLADLLEVADDEQPDRLKTKPVWKIPDGKPHDLELGYRALFTCDADTLVEWRARSMSRSTAALVDRLREAKRKRLTRSLQNVKAALKFGAVDLGVAPDTARGLAVSAREEKQRTLTGYGVAAMQKEATAADFEAIDKTPFFNLLERRYTQLIDAPARTLSARDATSNRPALSTSNTLWQATQSARSQATAFLPVGAAQLGNLVAPGELPKDAEVDYRLVIISSKLPAYELLLYALKNRPKPNFVPDWSLTQMVGADGVATPCGFLSKLDPQTGKCRYEQLDVIVYDYYATDFATLIGRIEQYFNIHDEDLLSERQTSVELRKPTRKARSIGLLCTWRTLQPEGASSQLVDPRNSEHVVELLPGVEFSATSTDHPDCTRLFNTLSLVLEADKKAAIDGSDAVASRFDLFTPMAAFTDGLKLLEHLHHVFGIRISSPISVNIDQSAYSYLQHDWIEMDVRSSTNLIQPPYTDYFQADMFLFWIRTASLLDDICKRMRSHFTWHVETLNRTLCDRLIGETLFGMLNVARVNSVLQPLTEVLSQLANPNRQLKANQSPLQFVADALQRMNKITLRKRNVATYAKLLPDSPSKSKRAQKVTIDGDAISESARSETSQVSVLANFVNGPNAEVQVDFDMPTPAHLPFSSTAAQSPDNLLTLSSFAALERRKLIALQILHTEKRYLALLNCVDSEVRAPLRAMMNGNRTIVAAHTMDILFSDLLFFANLSRQFVEHFQQRMQQWSPATAATIQLGPVYLQTIGVQMKLYANYIQNYPTILANVDRIIEKNSLFHAFLKKREMTIAMNMMKLHEFYLLPLTRLYEHENLLMYLIQQTPDDYMDMQTLKRALEKVQELLKFLSEHKKAEKLDMEDKLKEVAKQIAGCPNLAIIADKSLRGRLKRFFIARFDLIRLKLPPIATGDYQERMFVSPEYRIYQYLDDASLFLFNDCLIMTHRRYEHEPYGKMQKCIYDFETLVKLTEVELLDIVDTKYVQNALVIVASAEDKEWICQFQFLEDKFGFVAQFDKTKRLLIKFQNASSINEPSV